MIAMDNFILLGKLSEDPDCPPIVAISPTHNSVSHIAENIIPRSGTVVINAIKLLDAPEVELNIGVQVLSELTILNNGCKN
jgi:hypothetical protein